MGLARLLQKTRQSYPLKLVVAFGIVTLLVGTASVSLYVEADSILHHETQNKLESSAQLQAQALDEWLNEKRIQSRAISQAAPLRYGDYGDVVAYLWTVVENDDDVEAAYFVDTGNGTVISSVGSSRIVSSNGVIRTAGQRDFTRRAGNDDRVLVSEPFRAYQGGAPVFLLSAGIPGRDNRSIVTVVNLQKLSDSQAHQLDEARFQVQDDDGTVIMSENGSRILEHTAFEEVPTEETGVVRADYGGQEAVVGYASMERRHWTVLAWMPASQAFAIRSAITRGLAWMVATVLVGFAVIGLVLTRNTVKPLRELAKKAQILQAGSLDEPIETTRTDEFGELFEAFEGMRVSLRSQMDNVERARLESERLTRELKRDAEQFGTVMAACADGELDRRLEPSSDQPSMQNVATAFNEMMDDVEAQTEELEAFTSIISHDLRNPLNVAAGRTKLLLEDPSPEHVDHVVQALQRMERIVEDGLTLARGTEPGELRTVGVEDRATRAWRHVEVYDAHLSIADQGWVRADPNLLEQLFENLFRNAIEHAGRDVRVTVGVLEDGFFVEDDGPGLPEEAVGSVFEPGVSDGSGGVGLGLTIVRRIATAHGWTVQGMNGAEGARFEVHEGSPNVGPTESDREFVPDG